MTEVKILLINPAPFSRQVSTSSKKIRELTQIVNQIILKRCWIKPPLPQITGINPSLGLAYLGACLRKKGYDVKLIDSPSLDFKRKEILREIKKFSPNFIGITSTTPEFLEALKLAKAIKIKFKKIPILIGGAHATAMPVQTIKNKCFDVAAIGEGEVTIIELVESLLKKNELEKVKGIAFRKKNKIIITPKREYISNLDLLPFPAFDLLSPLKNYHSSPGSYKNLPIGTIITGRGCPFKCTFCARGVFGNQVRLRSAKNIVDEIEILIKKFGAKEIRVWDDTFNVKPQRVIDICKEIMKRKLNFSWTCLCRINFAQEKMLKLMKKAGCWQISYGIESGNQEILNKIKKGITLKMAEDVVKMTKKIGIEVKCFFMIGLPGDTKETMRETIDFAKKINPDIATFSITTPFPGTEIYDLAKKTGEFKEISFENYRPYETKRLAYVPKGLKAETVIKYQEKAYREFYLRPKVFLRELIKIRSFTMLQAKVLGLLSVQTKIPN